MLVVHVKGVYFSLCYSVLQMHFQTSETKAW